MESHRRTLEWSRRVSRPSSLMVLGFILLAGVAILVGRIAKDESSLGPNVILVTVDTLRADHLGCYRYPKKTSPHIDLFAGDALLFENCLAHAPLTGSSCASILSGFLPHETKVWRNIPLPEAVHTLPEILVQEGYKTCAVVSNYVLQPKGGWSQGFMVYDHEMLEREETRKCPERTAMPTTDRALEIIQSMKASPDERFFMWIHYQDPHGPYTPPPGFFNAFQDVTAESRPLEVNGSVSGRGGIPSYQYLDGNTDFFDYLSRYDGEIRYLDEQFGRLVEGLKKAGLYDEALVIFTADHGEEMGEHGYYFCHGETLYNSLVHVPLIIRYGTELTGRRMDYVQHIDIVPTVLNLLDIRIGLPFRGIDLRRMTGVRREIFAAMDSQMSKNGTKVSLTHDGFKLIHIPSIDTFELFDVRNDPREECNLINDAAKRKQAEEMKARLKRIRREDLLQIRKTWSKIHLTDEEIENMKSLGYIK